jgi:hypothetical protein
MTNQREPIELQRARRIAHLEAVADNELMAPKFREDAERQLDELGVGKNSQPVANWSAVFDDLEDEADD